MTEEYKTIFEVSYFGNGALFISLFFLVVPLTVLYIAGMVRNRMTPNEEKATYKKLSRFRLFILIFLAVGTLAVLHTLWEGYDLMSVLTSGECKVVEGPVQVLQRGSRSRHVDNWIQIRDKKFTYSPFNFDLSYHGSELLIDGIEARVHYHDNDILKVELKQ
jgi:hypothetical protein